MLTVWCLYCILAIHKIRFHLQGEQNCSQNYALCFIMKLTFTCSLLPSAVVYTWNDIAYAHSHVLTSSLQTLRSLFTMSNTHLCGEMLWGHLCQPPHKINSKRRLFWECLNIPPSQLLTKQSSTGSGIKWLYVGCHMNNCIITCTCIYSTFALYSALVILQGPN